jgi:hypothetical protein
MFGARGGGGAAVEVDRGMDAARREVEVHAAHAGDAAHLRVNGGLH